MLRSQRDHRGAKNRRINRQLGQITNDSHAYLSHGSSPSTVNTTNEKKKKKKKKERAAEDFYERRENSLYRFKYSQAHRGVANRSLIIYVREDVTIETRVEAFSGYGETFWPPKGRHLCTFRIRPRENLRRLYY